MKLWASTEDAFSLLRERVCFATGCLILPTETLVLSPDPEKVTLSPSSPPKRIPSHLAHHSPPWYLSGLYIPAGCLP